MSEKEKTIVNGGKSRDTLALRQERAWEKWRSYPRFGSCYRCGKGWDQINSHTTEVTSLKGIFICCEECWTQMTLDERLEAVDFIYYCIWRNMPKEGTIDIYIEAVKREWAIEEREIERVK